MKAIILESCAAYRYGGADKSSCAIVKKESDTEDTVTIEVDFPNAEIVGYLHVTEQERDELVEFLQQLKFK